MNNKIAFLTTVFPMEDDFLKVFLKSLANQTYKMFDVVVVNDGLDDFDVSIKKHPELNFIELRHSSTPSKNREYGINYCIQHGYDVLIFGDSDDYFSKNRVQKSVDFLSAHDIVVNDLSLFNSSGLYEKKYISNRLSNKAAIYLEFIKDKNIFGLSNTAINLRILDKVTFDKNLIAVDWYLFSILLLRGCTAIFTNEAETFYRQHSDNTIGLRSLSKKSIHKRRLIKLNHYKLLEKRNAFYGDLYDEMMSFDYLNENMKYVQNPLWWEEIK